MAAHSDIDSKAYIDHAHLLYTNHSFAWPKEGKPYYVLGYPFLLGVVYQLAGEESPWAIVLFQLLVSLLTGLLLFSLAYQLSGPWPARLAILLFSCNVGFLTFTQFILTEVVLAFLLTLFVWCTVKAIRVPSSFMIAASGLSLGLSVLIKPAGLYFSLLLVPFLGLIFFRSGLRLSRLIELLAEWILLFMLPIGLYAVHNQVVFGEAYVSKLGEQNLYYWFYPNVRAALYDSSADYERVELLALPLSTVKRMFWDDFAAHPFVYGMVWGKNMVKTVLGLFSTNLKVLIEPKTHGGDISFFKMSGTLFQKVRGYIEAGTTTGWLIGIAYAEACWSLIRLFFIVLGLWWLYGAAGDITCFLLLYLGYFLVITGHDGCARFRMMIEVPLVLLTALGIGALVMLLHGRRRQE